MLAIANFVKCFDFPANEGEPPTMPTRPIARIRGVHGVDILFVEPGNVPLKEPQQVDWS
jgi:hypothetical protein